jgi:hypothetical protein
MKIFKYFLVLSILNFVNCSLIIGETENCSSIINCAFKNITKSIAEKQREISIVNFGGDVDIIDRIVQKDSRLKYKIKNIKLKDKNNHYTTNESLILLFDNLKSLERFNLKTKTTNLGPKSYQFFVYVPGFTIVEIKASISETKYRRYRHLWSQLVAYEDSTEISHYLYFIADEGNFLKLYTFIWYSPNFCAAQ